MGYISPKNNLDSHEKKYNNCKKVISPARKTFRESKETGWRKRYGD